MATTAPDAERAVSKAEYTDFAHTEPGTLAGRYMRRFWQPVLRSQDLAPGRAKPIRIMSEDFTAYRGEGGAAHVVAFRCAHRGTQLSTGWVEDDDLRCFYHGWKYAADGRCLEQPAEPESFCEKVRIRSYPTEEYVGLIFAYLGEGEPPSLPRYPQMEAEGVYEVSATFTPCNFFNARENDPVHGYFVHRRPGNDWREWGGAVPIVTAEEDDFGVVEKTTRPGGGVSVSYKGMPNLSMRYGRFRATEPDKPGYIDMTWRVPIDDESHWRFAVELAFLTGKAGERYLQQQRALELAETGPDPGLLADLVLKGGALIEEVAREYALTFSHVVNLQDDVSQAGQGRIADRVHERLGRVDAGVILLRKVWTRELRALMEGWPLKQWTPPSSGPR